MSCNNLDLGWNTVFVLWDSLHNNINYLIDQANVGCIPFWFSHFQNVYYASWSKWYLHQQIDCCPTLLLIQGFLLDCWCILMWLALFYCVILNVLWEIVRPMGLLRVIVCGICIFLLEVYSINSGEVKCSCTDTTAVLLWVLGEFGPSISGSKSRAFIWMVSCYVVIFCSNWRTVSSNFVMQGRMLLI